MGPTGRRRCAGPVASFWNFQGTRRSPASFRVPASIFQAHRFSFCFRPRISASNSSHPALRSSL